MSYPITTPALGLGNLVSTLGTWTCVLCTVCGEEVGAEPVEVGCAVGGSSVVTQLSTRLPCEVEVDRPLHGVGGGLPKDTVSEPSAGTCPWLCLLPRWVVPS